MHMLNLPPLNPVPSTLHLSFPPLLLAGSGGKGGWEAALGELVGCLLPQAAEQAGWWLVRIRGLVGAWGLTPEQGGHKGLHCGAGRSVAGTDQALKEGRAEL